MSSSQILQKKKNKKLNRSKGEMSIALRLWKSVPEKSWVFWTDYIKSLLFQSLNCSLKNFSQEFAIPKNVATCEYQLLDIFSWTVNAMGALVLFSIWLPLNQDPSVNKINFWQHDKTRKARIFFQRNIFSTKIISHQTFILEKHFATSNEPLEAVEKNWPLSSSLQGSEAVLEVLVLQND